MLFCLWVCRERECVVDEGLILKLCFTNYNIGASTRGATQQFRFVVGLKCI